MKYYTTEQYIKDTKKVIKLIKKSLKKNPDCVAMKMTLEQEERELKKYSNSKAVAS